MARHSARRAESTLGARVWNVYVQVRRSRWKGHNEAPFEEGGFVACGRWARRTSGLALSIRSAGAGWWRSGGARPRARRAVGLGVGDDPQAGGPDVVGAEDPCPAADGLVVGVVVLGTEGTPVAGAVAGEQPGRVCALCAPVPEGRRGWPPAGRRRTAEGGPRSRSGRGQFPCPW